MLREEGRKGRCCSGDDGGKIDGVNSFAVNMQLLNPGDDKSLKKQLGHGVGAGLSDTGEPPCMCSLQVANGGQWESNMHFM